MKTVMLNRREMLKSILAVSGWSVAGAARVNPTSADLMVAAAGFDQTGGWLLDTQFIDTMGSPYLMAHGLGVPVANATSLVRFPQKGKWRVWVRTMDWVARWKAPGAPGRFQLLIDRNPLKTIFGDSGSQWHWQDGGVVEISKPEITLALHDLTGFNGRCEAIYFTQELTAAPPSRRPTSFKDPSPNRAILDFDLIVAGGGYAGMAAALSAGRMGLKTALVQNRSVLGGNASSEIHVPPRGLMPENGPYPHLGRVVRELQFDQNVESRMAIEADDAHYEQVLRAEKNIHLFLNHHVCAAEMNGDRLTGVWMLDTHAGLPTLITGRLFADCTGHATLGALAGAESVIGAGPVADGQRRRETPLMGMTNKWRWTWADAPSYFPETPWALDLSLDDFPLHQADLWGSWRWESGF
ncbi:FAD-dependent oxidoreductase, partial [bacterium]|nr:FAD-dependent oxidoreductase [bacterium]